MFVALIYSLAFMFLVKFTTVPMTWVISPLLLLGICLYIIIKRPLGKQSLYLAFSIPLGFAFFVVGIEEALVVCNNTSDFCLVPDPHFLAANFYHASIYFLAILGIREGRKARIYRVLPHRVVLAGGLLLLFTSNAFARFVGF